MSPRGRRPAGEDTRATLVAAARAEFAARGYDGASLRGIARAAGVDARLVHHYFEGKSALFAEVMAVPVNPAAIVAGVIRSGPPEELGARIVRMFLAVWDDPNHRPALIALARSALTMPEVAEQVRGYVVTGIVGQLVRSHPHAGRLGAGERRLRAGLIASQMLGLGITRYVVEVPGVAQAPVEVLVERLGPIIQGHLDG